MIILKRPPICFLRLLNISFLIILGDFLDNLTNRLKICALPFLSISLSIPFLNRSNACGTNNITVTLRSCIVLKIAFGRRLVIYVTSAPILKGNNSPPICSNMWLRGRIDSNLSSFRPVIICPTDSRLDSRFLWVNITPFGSPVVPEVNIISATSSVFTGASSTGFRESKAKGMSSININGMPIDSCSFGVA